MCIIEVLSLLRKHTENHKWFIWRFALYCFYKSLYNETAPFLKSFEAKCNNSFALVWRYTPQPRLGQAAMKIDYKELLYGQYTNNSHNNQQSQKEVDQPRTEKPLKRGQRSRIQKKKMTPRRLSEEEM